MAPKVVDKDARKREIAQAALGVFAKRGFEAASISEVAEAAGIGKGTVYEYFESKEALIFGALMEWVEAFNAVEFVSPSTVDPPERLREYARNAMKAFLEDPESLQLFVGLMQLILTNRSFFDRYPVLKEITRGLRTSVVDILLEGISRGVFRASMARDAETVAINLLAFLDGIALHHLTGGDFLDLQAQVDFYMDRLLENIEVKEGMA